MKSFQSQHLRSRWRWRFLNSWNFHYYAQPETFVLVIEGLVFVPVSAVIGKRVALAIIRDSEDLE
jgi:hypothetical protein